MVKSQKDIFQNQKLLSAHQASPTQEAYSQHSIAMYSMSMAGYVTAVLVFVCSELPAREGSNFCDFQKIISCDFTEFFSFLTRAKLCFSMCLIRSTIIAYLCPNMIKFNAFGFNECYSEGMIQYVSFDAQHRLLQLKTEKLTCRLWWHFYFL